LSLLVLALGLMVLFSYYKPLSLVPNEPLNQSDPFSAPFTLSNDWYSSIYDVTYKCRINRIERSHNRIITNTRVWDSRLSKESLGYKDKADLFCPIRQNVSIDEIITADISIEISFHIKFMPWARIMPFNFQTAKDDNGKWRWLYSPIVPINSN